MLLAEYRDDPDAAGARDRALGEVRAVLPLIAPTAEELIAARLTPERVVAFYLDRAALARPAIFAAQGMPRQLLRGVIDSGWRRVVSSSRSSATRWRSASCASC